MKHTMLFLKICLSVCCMIVLMYLENVTFCQEVSREDGQGNMRKKECVEALNLWEASLEKDTLDRDKVEQAIDEINKNDCLKDELFNAFMAGGVPDDSPERLVQLFHILFDKEAYLILNKIQCHLDFVPKQDRRQFIQSFLAIYNSDKEKGRKMDWLDSLSVYPQEGADEVLWEEIQFYSRNDELKIMSNLVEMYIMCLMKLHKKLSEERFEELLNLEKENCLNKILEIEELEKVLKSKRSKKKILEIRKNRGIRAKPERNIYFLMREYYSSFFIP